MPPLQVTEIVAVVRSGVLSVSDEVSINSDIRGHVAAFGLCAAGWLGLVVDVNLGAVDGGFNVEPGRGFDLGGCGDDFGAGDVLAGSGTEGSSRDGEG